MIAAAVRVVTDAGWGSGASPLVTGRSTVHAELEHLLAEFEGAEAAILFSSGYAAGVGTIPALVGSDDVVFSDAKNHACLIDGCRLSRARIVVYPHRDLETLEQQLRQAGTGGRRLIVTDSLFSMDGDATPIAELSELAACYDAMLLVDEAHATGVFGDRGRGVSDGIEGVHIRLGTLSKALGSAGGFVTGSRQLIEWLANRARSYVFSTAQPAATAAAAMAALEIVNQEPHRRHELLDRARELRQRLQAAGWNTADSTSQIIPIVIGEPKRTMELAHRLREAGLMVPGIRPPTVPEGESLLRVSLCASHSPEMIDQLVEVLGRA